MQRKSDIVQFNLFIRKIAVLTAGYTNLTLIIEMATQKSFN